MQFLLPVHIVAGGFAIVLGAAALLSAKGRTFHRRSGLLFVYAMITMGLSGSILALRQSLTNANVLGGITATYFVITSLTTVRPASRSTMPLNVVACAMAAGLGLIEVVLGYTAFSSPHGMLNGVPFFMLFFLASVTLGAAAGDLRIIRFGALRGGRRLARHLWRMCFALFIAAGSFFSIRARVVRILPAPLATPAMRALPILLVFVAMFYWLWRVRSRRPPAVGLRSADAVYPS